MYSSPIPGASRVLKKEVNVPKLHGKSVQLKPGNPRGSFGGESELSEQEVGWNKGGSFSSSDGGWEPDSWFLVTGKERRCWI